MNFQAITVVICFCYSAVNGGPIQSILGQVDTGFNVGLCNCPSGRSLTIIRKRAGKPIPFPFLVGIHKGMMSFGPNALGYYGEDALECKSCSPKLLAKLHVHLSLKNHQSDDPNDERLAIYKTDDSNFYIQRLQFKVKFAKSALIQTFGMIETLGGVIEADLGVCMVSSLPNDTKWHWVRCDWCTASAQLITRLTIKFEQNIKHHVKVKQLKLWTC